MYLRSLFPQLTTHLAEKQITVITGMRRVGKSTALKYLTDSVKHNNKLYLDFERIENRYLFNQTSYVDIERGLGILGLDLTKPSVLALDEIQLVPNSTSVIKSLYDNYNIKFIVTGSSSFYIKNHFSESLAGRKQIFEMSTLDFWEFLQFKGVDTKIFLSEKMKLYHQTSYLKFKALYEEYLNFGGFPEVVLSHSENTKRNYLSDVLNAYIELDIKLLGDFSVSDTLYKLILMLATRVGSRIDYSKMSTLIGMNRTKIKEYLKLLEYTYLIQVVAPFTSNLDKSISKQEKIYFSDTGLLQNCAKVSSGALFENGIANQLNRLGKLNYYEKSNGLEIDFILNGNTAFEVKETPSISDFNKLSRRAENLNLINHFLVGRHPSLSDFKKFIWGGNIF